MFRALVSALALLCILMSPAASAEAPPFPFWMSSGLYRTMSEQERAYLGKPLADVVVAMDRAAQANHAGHCFAQLSSGAPADPSKPADWVGDQGKLTPGGLTPAGWEIPVTCPGLHAVVSLSAVPLTVVSLPGDKPQAVGLDVFSTDGRLVIGDFLVATSVVPPTASRPTGDALATAWSSMPSLAKPLAVQIRATEDAGELDSYIDLPMARAALNNVPISAPSNPAVESDQQQGDEGTIRRTEESVLAYLARRNGQGRTVAIADTTWRGALPAESEIVLPAVAPTLLASAIADYRQKNRESKPIPSNLTVPDTTVALVSEASLRSYFRTGNMAAGWDKFAAKYGSRQLYTFSRVGVSRDLSQAVVFQGYQGPRIGVGSLLFLRREADSWRVLYQLRLWVEGTETAPRVSAPAPSVASRPTPPAETPAPSVSSSPIVAVAPPATPASPEPKPALPEPKPASPAPVVEVVGPKVGLAHVTLRFVNEVKTFRFDKAEFFVNGDRAGAPLAKLTDAATGTEVWQGSIPAGASILRLRLSYAGKGFFPFYYLDSFPFAREATHEFSPTRDDNVTLTVRAYQSQDPTVALENSLAVEVKTDGMSAPKPPPDMVSVANMGPPPKVGMARLKVRFVNAVGQFRFDRAEFYINGDRAGVPLKKVTEGSSAALDVWEGSIPAGASVLRAQLSYTSKAFFPFYYLDTYPLTRAVTKNFSPSRDGNMTLTVTASESPGFLKLMEDTLSVDVQEEPAGRGTHGG